VVVQKGSMFFHCSVPVRIGKSITT
jgi:hypothetical protein